MRQQSCTYEIDYGTRDFAILAVLFKAQKIVYACACLVPHPFWPDQLKIASAGPDNASRMYATCTTVIVRCVYIRTYA